MAPRVGLEPTAYRLTAECSTIELPWNTCVVVIITADNNSYFKRFSASCQAFF